MRDLYQEVTDRILAILKQGTVPPGNGLTKRQSAALPDHAVTKRPYSGINLPLGREACVCSALRFRQRRVVKGPPVSSVFLLVYQGPRVKKAQWRKGIAHKGKRPTRKG